MDSQIIKKAPVKRRFWKNNQGYWKGGDFVADEFVVEYTHGHQLTSFSALFWITGLRYIDWSKSETVAHRNNGPP